MLVDLTEGRVDTGQGTNACPVPVQCSEGTWRWPRAWELLAVGGTGYGRSQGAQSRMLVQVPTL